MPNPVKSLGCIKCQCYSSSSPRSVKNLSNSVKYNCQKSCSSLRRPETILEIRKKVTFLQMMNNPFTYKFFKDFTNTEIRLTEWQFLAVDLSPTFLNTWTTYEIFQQSRKQDNFRHLLKSSASMYEFSGSQFFRTTTGIQSGPHRDESRLVMTFLTVFGGT